MAEEYYEAKQEAGADFILESDQYQELFSALLRVRDKLQEALDLINKVV